MSQFLAGHALCRDTETFIHVAGRRSENGALRRQIVCPAFCRGVRVDDRVEQDGVALRLTTCGGSGKGSSQDPDSSSSVPSGLPSTMPWLLAGACSM